MTSYLLGIDNGGTVTKVVLFDTAGNQIFLSSQVLDTQYSNPGWTERDMVGVWQTTVTAIREAIVGAGIDPKDILAIGNASHGNGIYLLDKQGKPLRPAILSLDTRATELLDRWQTDGLTDKLWERTYQQLWTGQPPVLLAWLKAHEPDNYKNIGAALLSKDYIKYRLTGQYSTDFTDMSATSLFNLPHKIYDDDILRLLGIPEMRSALAKPIASHEIAGKVTTEAANITGLLAGTPVVGGMFDVSASALGAGVIHAGQVCIIAGTWSINEVVTDSLVDDRHIFMNSIYTDTSYLVIEASATSATNLEWFVTQFCDAEKAEAKRRGISVYEVCNELVSQLPPGSTNILFHPFLYGSNVQPTARAGFYGIAGWHNKKHMLRAIYEGVVYGHMSHLERLRQAGIPIETARLTGGGARSAVWSQMFADAINIPCELVNGEEIGAKGAALCAGIAMGVYRDYADAVAQTVRVTKRYEPHADATPLYAERFKEHQFLTSVMKEAWNRLSSLERQ
ncbi:MAG: carbohydrate kinase [Anaerolineae bacterium]|nr:carbohydrate kinase [Anaerolineae bacterium]